MKKDLLLESFLNSELSMTDMKHLKGGLLDYSYKLNSKTGPIFVVVGDSGTTYWDCIGVQIYPGNQDAILA